MKKSVFTSAFPLLNGRTILYNSFTDKFLVCLTEKLGKNIDDLSSQSPTLRNKLIESGMLVEEDVDEVKKLKNLIDEVDNDEKVFHLHVNPTLDCNISK